MNSKLHGKLLTSDYIKLYYRIITINNHMYVHMYGMFVDVVFTLSNDIPSYNLKTNIYTHRPVLILSYISVSRKF